MTDLIGVRMFEMTRGPTALHGVEVQVRVRLVLAARHAARPVITWSESVGQCVQVHNEQTVGQYRPLERNRRRKIWRRTTWRRRML
jgi:hypothetical protein